MLYEDDISTSTTSMKGLVERIAKALVNEPDSVFVREIEETDVTIFNLSVAPDDMGRIIGKRGRIANAIRVLLRMAAAKEGKRVTLEIEPTQTGEEDRPDSAQI